MPDPPATITETDAAVPPRLLSATLYCENCGQPTPHRILRIDRRGARAAGRLRGVARCRECRFTHAFESAEEGRSEIALIVSAGPTSERSRISLPSARRLQVGSGVPGTEVPLTVHRIEGPAGRAMTSARVAEIATVWATRDEGAVVQVSVVEGRDTRSVRLPLPHGTVLRIGDDLALEELTVEIVGLRARGHTWRRPGDAFTADEVARVYARRISSPPAGKSPWRRVRVSSSARASSTSTASRARSGPGTSRTRTDPRARRAAGGAAVQSVSPR
jgi:uncharacterized Zn finger protein